MKQKSIETRLVTSVAHFVPKEERSSKPFLMGYYSHIDLSMVHKSYYRICITAYVICGTKRFPD